MTPDNDPNKLYPGFRERFQAALDDTNAWCAAHQPRVKFILGEGYRSRQRQMDLYAEGRSAPGSIVTKLDGVHQISGHQTCLAADAWTEVNGQVVWSGIPDECYQQYGHCLRAHGLVWGGDWDSDQQSSDEEFVDFPHGEWPRHDTGVYAAAAAWKRAQGFA